MKKYKIFTKNSFMERVIVFIKMIIVISPNLWKVIEVKAYFHYIFTIGMDKKDIIIINNELQKAKLSYSKILNKKYGYELYK
jgi:hypothetical protein